MNLTTKPHTKTPREIAQAASLAVSWAASVFSRSGPFLAREVACFVLLFTCLPTTDTSSVYVSFISPLFFLRFSFMSIKVLWYADLILTFSLSREMLLWAEKLTYQPDSSMLRKWLIFSYLVRCLGFTFPSVCAPNEAELGRILS